MIELVSKVETFLAEKNILQNGVQAEFNPTSEDIQEMAGIRKKIGALTGKPMLARLDSEPQAAGFAGLEVLETIATRGPITPDHTIHTKLKPVILAEDIDLAINNYAEEYRKYFARNNRAELTCLDPAPRFAVWKHKGLISFGQNVKRLQVIGDISRHTIKAIQWAEALGGWKALPENDLFDVEYWELEQAKLKKAGNSPAMEGKVVLVSGAASGIGKACVEEFVAAGACVLALDINPEVTSLFMSAQVKGLICDVSDVAAMKEAIHAGVCTFGGLDIIVSNAGSFTPSEKLADMSDEHWQTSLNLNLSSHMKLMRAALPFLEQGFEPAIVFIASKNVPAPGPGAGAYSTAKAGLTQMARVAALELGGAGIRVNVLHPNAVFDTGVWDVETLEKRAQHYGLSVEEYKQNNVLKKEVTSQDVAVLARMFAGQETACTTGAQVPVDGGNERVI
jgi:NAD(P)-dependent dehydrogenase (short-subunit alcohol dehydrogenase family)